MLYFSTAYTNFCFGLAKILTPIFLVTTTSLLRHKCTVTNIHYSSLLLINRDYQQQQVCMTITLH